MKRILALVILALFISANAFAANKVATFGDYNSSGVYRMTATDDGVITYAQDTGIVDPYLGTATTNATLTAAQSGTTVVLSNGGGAAVNATQYTLPAATVGLNYAFIADVAKYMIVHPNGTDTIDYSTIPAGNGIKNTTAAIGDSIELICVNSGKWSVKNITGTWATSNQ